MKEKESANDKKKELQLHFKKELNLAAKKLKLMIILKKLIKNGKIIKLLQ